KTCRPQVVDAEQVSGAALLFRLTLAPQLLLWKATPPGGLVHRRLAVAFARSPPPGTDFAPSDTVFHSPRGVRCHASFSRRHVARRPRALPPTDPPHDAPGRRSSRARPDARGLLP